MNPSGWTPLGHTSSTFLLPHMGVHVQNNFNPNSVHRFLAAPLSVNSQEQTDRPTEQQQQSQQAQQVTGDIQQIGVTAEDNRANNSNTPLLDTVHVPFQPLRQLSVDLLTNWPESEQQQQERQPQSTATLQVAEIQHTTPLPQGQATPNFEGVSEADISSTVAQIHSQLKNEGDGSGGQIRSKKRRSLKPQPETWKKNVRKNARAKGEAYQSATGKLMPARSVKEVDCAKCRLRCTEWITEEARRAIFESYWGTASYIRQRDFICSHIIEDEKARSTVKQGEETRKREVTRQYWLPEKNGKLHRVCKSFFLGTLDIGAKIVDCAMKKRQGFGFFCDDDKRGRHEPSNKVSEEKLDFIREHIESFRNLNVSQNKKRKNGRIVLPSEYNIRKMYQMYTEHCVRLGEEVQKEHTYRRIFNMEYNITFEEPNKDGVVIRSPADQDKFLGKRPAPPTSQPGPSAKKTVFRPADQALLSHQTLVQHRIEQVRMEANQNNEQVKERNRQLLLMKPPQPQPNQPPPQQAPPQQTAADTIHSSLQQHIITSHAMPQYSSAPPHHPPHFVLPSNPGRPLEAVNMSQFSMHPSILHHHHHANN